MSDYIIRNIIKRCNSCIDRPPRYMHVKYVTPTDEQDVYFHHMSIHKNLERFPGGDHQYTHLEINDHPGLPESCRRMWLNITRANFGLTDMEAQLAEQVVDNAPMGTSFQMANDGDWTVRYQDDLTELDILNLMSEHPVSPTHNDEQESGDDR